MNKAERFFLGVGTVFLLLGLLWPWLQLDPPAEKDKQLIQLASMLNKTESLPQPVQLFLQDRGWKTYHTLPKIKAFFTNGLGVGHIFDQLYGKTRLFSWEFFRLDAGNGTLLLVGVLIGLCVLSGIVLIYLLRQKKRMPNKDGEDWVDYWEDDWEGTGGISSRSNIGQVVAVISLIAFVTFFVFIIQMPSLDSLGRAGERGMILMDVVFNMRITIAPRFFIPAGLLCLTLAGVENVLMWASQRHSRDLAHEDIDY